ncbi:Disease resistance RPP8-like protein 3 [Sesamum angolense]|uniref:Disease resistance RPP8-like protein 3 n=1 Tax=Sesamum angolense TaxID=2727404 RepID=A0AAE2C1Y4_9LAMI|nr:Disease resistance RPP8-like protein 3 [Sesamum angolense]
MADAAISFVLENLAQLLIRELREFFISKKEVTAKINQIQASVLLLQPQESNPPRRASDFRLSLQRETKDIIYRFENVKENFAIVVGSRRPFSSRYFKELREIYTELLEIENKIFLLEENTALEDMELLLSYIKNPSCRVIGICGMGGSGKTRLARRLCNDAQVKDQFDVVAWVHVSLDFQPRRSFENLYVQLDRNHKGPVSDMNESDLARRIYRIQQKRKCLIVLDDLWSSDAWGTLCVAFPSGKTDSKILITSRVIQVVEAAEIVAGKRYIHKLRPLTQAEGCQLFMNGLVPDFLDNEIVEEMGKEMVKCCEGLPSAILDFIDFMQIRNHTLSWMEVRRNLESYVRESQEYGTTLKSLTLSYDNLPHDLKQCFLYLGHSQEHSRIEVEKLYLLWLAEGLISVEDCGREEMLLNVAERYLEDLARRSMIEVQEEEVTTVTRFMSCQLSQQMRRLCLMKSEEQNFFRVVDFGCDTHQSQREVVWPQQLSSLVKFKYLRILEFMGISFEVRSLILEGIGKLVHLRYLSFRDCTLPELPSSIGNLKLLYVLDLRVVNTMVIPDVLWKLKKLKHLYFPLSFKTHGARKLRLDGLTDLETVTNLNMKMCNVEDLFELYNLHYIALSIPGSLEEIELIVKLMNMNSEARSLRASLEVSNFDCYTEERLAALKQLLECQSLIVLCFGGHISRLPLHDEISSNLAKIVLDGSELMEDPMPTLEKLPKLRVLVLGVDAFAGKSLSCSALGFIELRRLELLNSQYLEKWTVEEGAMLRLSILTIVNCKKLKELPKGLLSVSTLQQIRVKGMCKEFQESTSEFQHELTIIIED